MIKDKFSYLIDLCMEVQRGKDGNIESRVAKEYRGALASDSIGPTVFLRFLGHMGSLEVSIHKNGWDKYKKPDEIFEFDLTKEIDKEEFESCKTALEEIIRKQKEQEEES